MKKVITIAPMQSVTPDGMGYTAVNNERLRYDVPNCFPVLPLLHGYAAPGETVEVFILTTEGHEISQKIYWEIEREAAALCKQMNVSCTVSRIGIPFDETANTHLSTFQEIVSQISDGDVLLADMTYGSKCLALVLMMALNYGYRACDNCTIECFVYGSKDFRAGHPLGKRIYDITSLFLMDQIVNELAKSGNKDPLRAIKSILSMNATLEGEE